MMGADLFYYLYLLLPFFGRLGCHGVSMTNPISMTAILAVT